MIGSAKITYTNENVCQLVRKDLVDKFGNRELANYNLYLPGVVRSKAVIDQFPDPEVKITSVEEQLREMGIYPLPKVPRNPDTVYVASGLFDSILYSTFDYRTGRLVITGGPVTWTVPETSEFPYPAHWYGVFAEFPLGFEFAEGDCVPFSLNGNPLVHIISEEDEDTGRILFFFDAKYTTSNILIHWSDRFAPEPIYITCNASLANKGVDKIPAFPTEPKIEFTYPTGVVTDSNVQVDVDLDLGKN